MEISKIHRQEWGPPYEEAWNWLWSTVERLLRKETEMAFDSWDFNGFHVVHVTFMWVDDGR